MAKRSIRTIKRIDLGDGTHTYARQAADTFTAFYDARTTEPLAAEEIVARPTLFVLAIYDGVFEEWETVGLAPPSAPEIATPPTCRRSVVDPNLVQIVEIDGSTRPGTPEECAALEPETVWDADEVIERLRDHYAGRPNARLEFIKSGR